MTGGAWQFEVLPLVDVEAICVLELPEDSTLDDLHEAISEQYALPLYDGYAFFMNGDMDGEEFQYGPQSTIAPHSSEDTTLERLSLKPNKRFLYAFDESEEYALWVRALGHVESTAGEVRVLRKAGRLEQVYAHLLDETFEDEAGDHLPGDDPHRPGGSDDAVVEVSPDLAALGREIAPRYERWVQLEEARQELYERQVDEAPFDEDEADALGFDTEGDRSGGPDEPEAEIRMDADLAERLLDLTKGDRGRIHLGVEHGIDGPIWPWLLSLPPRLSNAGDHARAAELCRRIDDTRLVHERYIRLPLYLARAGRTEEAVAQIEDNLERHPEDMLALRYSGEALVELGDTKRGEQHLREALYWAGGHSELRGELVDILFALLATSGRHDDLKALLDSETRRHRELVERLTGDGPGDGPDGADGRAMASRRASAPGEASGSAKIGRNDPCPCGSGKKFKKCCGG